LTPDLKFLCAYFGLMTPPENQIGARSGSTGDLRNAASAGPWTFIRSRFNGTYLHQLVKHPALALSTRPDVFRGSVEIRNQAHHSAGVTQAPA